MLCLPSRKVRGRQRNRYEEARSSQHVLPAAVPCNVGATWIVVRSPPGTAASPELGHAMSSRGKGHRAPLC